jgi:hypothetical protein
MDSSRTLVLVTSVINTPQLPLSYTNVRSVFNRQQRFEQTQKTITTVKDKIPNSLIMIIECSDLTEEENHFININTDYQLNLFQQIDLYPSIFGVSKALGEGTMTIEAIKFIKKKNIKFEYFIKISGRYWLNDKFDFKQYNTESAVIKYSGGSIITVLYKINYPDVFKLLEFLISKIPDMKRCIQYEKMVIEFFESLSCDLLQAEFLGVSGLVSVCGSNYSS